MTLKEHIETAKRLVKARKDLMTLYCMGPKRIKVISKVEQIRMYQVVRLIDGVKNTLDNVYCRSVDDKTLEKFGFIWAH